jgi:hypothetical protein
VWEDESFLSLPFCGYCASAQNQRKTAPTRGKTVDYPLVSRAAYMGFISRAERRQVNDARRKEKESEGWNFRLCFHARPQSAPSFPRFFARASSS